MTNNKSSRGKKKVIVCVIPVILSSLVKSKSERQHSMKSLRTGAVSTTRYVSYIFTVREKQSDIVFTHYDDTAAVLYFKTQVFLICLCV